MRENRNRKNAEEVGATGLDDALSLLGVKEAPESKNVKVLFNAFSEKHTPIVRSENPGLKLSQVKDRVFQLWQKSPENPKNQAP